jgi:hypothetical protein
MQNDPNAVKMPDPPKCPKCKSTKVPLAERDLVWEETWYQCKDCRHEWCRG